MGRFRLLLILMLVAAVDLGSPVLPQASEAAEEFQETTHARLIERGGRHAHSADAVLTDARRSSTTASEALERAVSSPIPQSRAGSAPILLMPYRWQIQLRSARAQR